MCRVEVTKEKVRKPERRNGKTRNGGDVNGNVSPISWIMSNNPSIMKSEDDSNVKNQIEVNEDSNEGLTKRHAQKGQWKTPPVATFATIPSTSTAGNSGMSLPEFDSTGLGDILIGSLSVSQSTDDIAKALQEAYRRGQEAYRKKAEAVAAVNPSANSLVRFSNQVQPFGYVATDPCIQNKPDVVAVNMLETMKTVVPTVTRPDLKNSTSFMKATNITQPLIPDATRLNPVYYQSQNIDNPSSFIYNPSTLGSTNHTRHDMLKSSVSADKLPQINVPVEMMKPPTCFIPSQTPIINPSHCVVSNLSLPDMSSANFVRTSHSRPSLVDGNHRVPIPSRSVSLPDISTYAAQNSAEEQKRLKRLERNRASARLRRLKKKNLVSVQIPIILYEPWYVV